MDSIFSKTVKSGKTTYFIDIREAKNKSKYLTISESKPSTTDASKFTRKSIIVFDNSIQKFRDALEEAIQMINK